MTLDPPISTPGCPRSPLPSVGSSGRRVVAPASNDLLGPGSLVASAFRAPSMEWDGRAKQRQRVALRLARSWLPRHHLHSHGAHQAAPPQHMPTSTHSLEATFMLAQTAQPAGLRAALTFTPCPRPPARSALLCSATMLTQPLHTALILSKRRPGR